MTTADPRSWRISPRFALTLDRPRIMAILNITPDSFFDGGRLSDPRAAADAAHRAVEQGADVLDVGGESTRPGAARVGADDQTRRVIPVIAAIRRGAGPASAVPITIDTTRAATAQAALDAGADAVNDVSAGLEDPGMLELAASRGCGVVLMHRLRPPDADQYSDRYADPPVYEGGVVPAVLEFLARRAAAAIGAGVPRDAIVLDPGLGFGKSVGQNIELIRRTGVLAALGFPILSGISRKSFTGAWAGVRGSTPAERLGPTITLSLEHLHAGAIIFRVHDVAEHAAALRREWDAMSRRG